MHTGFETEVDEEFVAQATDELFRCLLAKNLAFIDRYHSGRLKSILRITGLAASLLGILLCVVTGLLVPDRCPAWLTVKLYLPLFIGGFLIFYYLPKLDRLVRGWSARNARRQCRKRAIRSMRKVKELVPLTVEYDIRGDVLTCFRRKHGRIRLAWSKRLAGVACQGELVTVIFRKPTSIQPRVIILHRGNTALREILRELSVEVKPTTGE